LETVPGLRLNRWKCLTKLKKDWKRQIFFVSSEAKKVL